MFRPALRGRPVVVLSNNDGCAIARSNEAKALGIAMAEPWPYIRRRLQGHRTGDGYVPKRPELLPLRTLDYS